MEEWRALSETGDKYLVSNFGRVYSNITNKIRKTKINNSGYEMITLAVDGKEITRLIHRLVAMEFCEGYKEGMVVNHKDSNKLNNHSDNLEWMSQLDNIHEMRDRGALNIVEAHKAAREARKRVTVQMDMEGNEIATFPSATEASKHTGINCNYISRCATGERRSTGGFTWKYIS